MILGIKDFLIRISILVFLFSPIATSAGNRVSEMAHGELLTGILPVLYINVYEEDGTTFNDEIIDRNLDHKNYFSAEYWLDTNGCSWLESLGAASIGSSDSPLPLEIKARGNYTRVAFSKKPFKIKLGKKQNLLGLSKSKHFALLAEADDDLGFLRNYMGFNIGQRMGLSWTPSQQPVELVINGDYRGLYFLTESIRVESDRVEITELDDLDEDPAHVSGGYLVELDNYDETNQIKLSEKYCAADQASKQNVIRITWDTPEEYSELQKRFITDQFTAINDCIGSNSDDTWKYLDLDDAVRYYLVEELMYDLEAYQGSTYLFRDHGENQKWHFGPLWDFGNSYAWGGLGSFLYYNTRFNNCWIPSMRCNGRFNEKLRDTWLWFMTSRFDGLLDDIDAFVDHIREAAKSDHLRWVDEEKPDHVKGAPVVDNSNMIAKKDIMVDWFLDRINWLKIQFGDFTNVSYVEEPPRDETPAAPLPDYAKPSVEDGVDGIVVDGGVSSVEKLYNLQGIPVINPEKGQVYIRVNGNKSEKIRY